MRKVTIFYNTGKVSTHERNGTTPEIQRLFYIGRKIEGKEINALTIEN